jgi:Flp pilus assembly CpaF family ATPase
VLSERLARGVDQATQRTVNRDINNLSQNTQQRVAEQGSTDLNRLVAAQQDVFERDFAKAEADRINAGVGLAVSSTQHLSALNADAVNKGRNTFNTVQKINKALNTPLDQRQPFIDGAARVGFTVNSAFAVSGSNGSYLTEAERLIAVTCPKVRQNNA